VVERTERNAHVAEEGDDFVDKFHDGILILFEFSFVTFITKRSLLLTISPINLFCDLNQKIIKPRFSFRFTETAP
jgi:hypothetical protein